MTTIRPPAKRGHWIFSVNPHHYHWDTLFVKGKEMWRGAGTRPDAIRALKQVRKGDRVLCYHSAPERALYAIAEVTRDPYPDPHDRESKMMVADLRAMERLPRQIPLDELRDNASVRKVKFLKNVRLIISPHRSRKTSIRRSCEWRELSLLPASRCLEAVISDL